MQRLLVVFALVAAAGCLRDNPDYGVGPGTGDPGPGPISGPGPSPTDPGKPDLSVASTPHDMAMSIPPGPGVDLSAPPDLASSAVPGSGVACGPTSCTAPQYCCFGALNAPTCVTPGLLTCVGGRQVQCDGPEDCAGDTTCCGSVLGSSCLQHCPEPAQLCHTSADCKDGSDHCCQTPFGYFACGKQSC